jgi:uncharacterized membrane protein
VAVQNKAVARFWEIDFARGFAVLLMLVFNWQFALWYFGLLSFDVNGFWFYFARSVVALFVFVSGVSFWVSYSKAREKLNAKDLRVKFLMRSAFLLSLGFAVTLATWFFLRQGFVVFGILHLLGLSVLLALPLVRLSSRWLMLLGGAIACAGVYLTSLRFDFPWLLWLGFVPSGFYSIDFEPVLPWFAVFLFGVAIGKMFFIQGKRRLVFPGEKSIVSKLVCLAGRNSLLIYVLHQPFLIAVLWLLGFRTLF